MCIEYFPEPEERKPDSQCVNCCKDLFAGDTIAEYGEAHVCEDCMTEFAMEHAKAGDFREFLGEKFLKQVFTEWFYGPDKIHELTKEED
jgi:hypothetical protein